MKIFLISQGDLDAYDYYDSAVVVAEDVDDARTIHPSGSLVYGKDGKWMSKDINEKEYVYERDAWVRFEDINLLDVVYIGEASAEQKRGVVLDSFNAG